MASYKVSYKMLKEQGESIKAVAKQMDGYAEKIGQIAGKISADDMLRETKSNLQRFSSQLSEAQLLLAAAGELLVATVEAYTGTETRQVQKVDRLRAHNRDFYKNPVVVASVTSTTTNVNTTNVSYTDNSTVNYNAAPVTTSAPIASAPVSAPVTTSAPVETVPAAAVTGTGATVAAGAAGTVAAAAAVLGGGAGVVGTLGAQHAKEESARKKAKAAETRDADYDPEQELEAALERVRELSEE